jgi:hypothetical protein
MTYDFHGQWERQVGHNSPLYPLESATSYQKKLTVVSMESLQCQHGLAGCHISKFLCTADRSKVLQQCVWFVLWCLELWHPLSCVKCLKNVYVYSVALRVELECSCKHSHSTTSRCHNYGKQYMTITAENLKFMFWCQNICRCLWNSVEQDMWLAEAIYFSHKILFPVEIHGYCCTLHTMFLILHRQIYIYIYIIFFRKWVRNVQHSLVLNIAETWMLLCCPSWLYVDELHKNNDFFLPADSMQIGSVQLCHFSTYCPMYHTVHANDLLCLQLHTVRCQFF